MYIKNILSASGLPGLYKLVSNRANGLILENIQDGKKFFAASRKHQFSPLESIGIYTDIDTIEISKVMDRIHENVVKTEIPSKKASSKEYTTYFSIIVPEYDRDLVKTGDIKRLVSWYRTLVKAEYHLKSEEEE